MKLATFVRDGIPTPGLVRDGRIAALDALDARLPQSMDAVLAGGGDLLAAVMRVAQRVGPDQALADVRLLPPVRPRKYLAIGMNYSSHVDEMRGRGVPIPDPGNQMWFNKQVTCLNGPYDPIHLPSVSEQLDFEGELGVVIGRQCRHVTEADALQVVAGYLAVNDVSVRDWQKRSPTATLGKSFDTHGPIGPWLTTIDEVPEPERLVIRTTVDGQVMQEGNTSELINGIARMIAYLSTVMTLEPGDLLATGTPHGVGAGRTPPVWLKSGQRVRVEIEGLGHIENEVIPEPASTRLI